jgi:hypothetical protein
MRRTSVIVAAASLAIAGLSIPTSRWASAANDRDPTNSSNSNTGVGQNQSNQPGQPNQLQQQQSDQQSAGQSGLRIPAFEPGSDRNKPQAAAGQMPLSATDEQAVRNALARVVDDATTSGKFGDLLNQLSRSDADRMNGRSSVSRTGADNAGSSRLDTSTSGGSGTPDGIGTSGGTATGTTGAGNTSAVSTSGTSSGTTSGTGASSGTSGASAGTGAGTRTGIGSDRSNAAAAALDISDLDARISQFQRDWKAKYNQEFSLRSNEKQVLSENFARINSSDYSDAARTAGERLAPGVTRTGTTSGIDTGTGTTSSGINGNTTAPPATPAAAGTTNTRTEAQGTAIGRYGTAGAERGDTAAHGSAVALVSGAPNTTPVILRFLNEGGQWKLDLPDSLDRQQLKANLIKHIDMVHRQKDSWPADPNEAYRVVTQNVLMAFNEDITQRGGGALDRGRVNRSGLETGTGTSSGDNSTNGTRNNSDR